MVLCSGKISSYGSICALNKNAEKWTDLNFLENGSKNFAHVGNFNETNDVLLNSSDVLCSGKFWISSYGSIHA